MFKKIKERREYKRKVQEIVDGIKKLDSQQPDSYLQADLDYRRYKYEKRSAIKERLFDFFKKVVFIPLIQIFGIASAILKFGLVISVFTFFYGLYLAYKHFFRALPVDFTVMVVTLILPFAISLTSFTIDYLAEKMGDSL